MLYEATWAAVRFHPAVRNTYLGLKEKGKPEKMIQVAAVQEQLLIAHSIYKTGERFNPVQEVRP